MACTLLRLLQITLGWCRAVNDPPPEQQQQTAAWEQNEKRVDEDDICSSQPLSIGGDTALFLGDVESGQPAAGAATEHGLSSPQGLLIHSRSAEEVRPPTAVRRAPSPFQRQSSFCIDSDERLDREPEDDEDRDADLREPSFRKRVSAEVHPTPTDAEPPTPFGVVSDEEEGEDESRQTPRLRFQDDEEEDDDAGSINVAAVSPASTSSSSSSARGRCTVRVFLQLPRPTSPLASVPEDQAWGDDEDDDDEELVLELDDEEEEESEGGDKNCGGGNSKKKKQRGQAELQRASSTESRALARMMEERRRLLIRQDGTQLSDDDDDDDAEPRAKVRYNDTGSLEEVDEEALDQFATEELLGRQGPRGLLGPTPTTSGPGAADVPSLRQPAAGDSTSATKAEDGESSRLREQYRSLWKLRATLEEKVDSLEEDEEEDDDDQVVTAPDKRPTADEDEEEETVEVEADKDELIAALLPQSSSSDQALRAEDLVTSAEDQSPETDEHVSAANPAPNPAPAHDTTPVTSSAKEETAGVKPETKGTASSKERREHYKSILARRLRRDKATVVVSSGGPGGGGGGPGAGAVATTMVAGAPSSTHSSADDSFDSIETEEGSSSHVATTSFESTTDNTDSPGEGQTSRLQQMKADSGYKSLEATNGQGQAKPPKLAKKQIHFALDKDEGVSIEDPDASLSLDDESLKTAIAVPVTAAIPATLTTSVTATATASPRHKTDKMGVRELLAALDDPFPPLEEEEDRVPATKASVFSRFFRSGSARELRSGTSYAAGSGGRGKFARDYSIDEKSDLLFREFSRIDPAYETMSDGSFRSRSPRLHQQRHHGSRSSTSSSSGRRRMSQPELGSLASSMTTTTVTATGDRLAEEETV